MEIFTQDGGMFISRWAHVFSGIAWIGLLYYFNFVQVPSFAEMDAAHRTGAITKLVPRALWWFRFAAMATLVSGIAILAFQKEDGDYFKSSQGMAISAGILMALVMFYNVWRVIWPNQQVVIASAESVAGGGEADPEAAGCGRKAFIASRTNALLSVPMLFFMVGTSHFFVSSHFNYMPDASVRGVYWAIIFAVVVVLEMNALGIIAGTGPGPFKKPLETVKSVIISSFVLTAALYVIVWEMVMRSPDL